MLSLPAGGTGDRIHRAGVQSAMTRSTPAPAILIACVLCVLLIAAPGARQDPPPKPPPADPQEQPPVIRTGINYVRVDVIVTDGRGNPVLDLGPDDFTIHEGGKLQRIDSFTLVQVDPIAQAEERPRDIRTVADEEREAARPDTRLFVILLDDYHVRRGNDMAVRQPLIEFIERQLAPNDMVALMYPLTPVSDIRFTRNRDSLIGAIKQFEGRKFNYEPRNMFEQQYAFYPAATVERIRNQVTMSALEGACIHMGGLREGRKSIIMVSEGFTAVLPQQLNDPIAVMPGFRNPNRGNPNAPVADDRTRMNAMADMNWDMRGVFDACNRQNTAIYPVDPRGLAVFEYGIQDSVMINADATDLRASLDTLRVLASNTDGRAILNRNDLATGMQQILRDSSAYYLLGYDSSEAPTDGKFHEIKVNVKRRGVDVRARKGYWAYTVEEAAAANAPPKPEAPSAVSDALAGLAVPPGGRSTRYWVGAARGDDGASRMTFVWEAMAPPAGARRMETAARVSLTALAPSGEPLFRDRIPAASGAPSATPHGAASFEAPPGRVQLRIVFEGAQGEVLDSAVEEITVPDFTQVEVSFATPRVYRARTVRELQVLKGQPDAAPTSDREFSRTERLFIRAEAYAPGGTTPEVTARLLNRAGDRMADLPVQTNPAGFIELEVPLAAFAAGEYLVELNARNPAGSTAQELIAFRVGR
jgi:VWFA-related protein